MGRKVHLVQDFEDYKDDERTYFYFMLFVFVVGIFLVCYLAVKFSDHFQVSLEKTGIAFFVIYGILVLLFLFRKKIKKQIIKRRR